MPNILMKLPADNLALLLFPWRTCGRRILHFLYKVWLSHVHCKSPVAIFWLEKCWKQTRWITGKATESVHRREARISQRVGQFPLTHFYIVFNI